MTCSLRVLKLIVAISALSITETTALLGAVNAANDMPGSDVLSILEKPLAIEVGDVTFQLRGSIDQAAHYDHRGRDFDARTSAGFELSAETQLRNQWNVEASYSGDFKTDPKSISDVGGGGDNKRYSQNIRGSVGGIWGKLLFGNVNDIVEDATTRKQQIGNASLAFENGLGNLNDWAVGYSGRFGPAVLSALIDDDANFDAGIRVSRPLGNKDFGFAVRGTLGTFTSDDGTTAFDTAGIKVGADVIYGSMLLDFGLGYERFSAGVIDVDRVYVSAGVQHKTGVVTVSLNGHYGQLDGNEEFSAALGGRYDFARGLSANLGVNYAELNANVGGVDLVSKDALETTLSLRYDF